MRIISGDAKSLVSTVRKRVDERIAELEDSLERETTEKVGRARSQAKQIRDQLMAQAGKDAERIRQERILGAQQEAKQMLIHSKGRIEEGLMAQIKAELLDFVRGKRRIENLSYDDLVDKALEQGKKRKISFTLTKHEDGVVLASPDRELDLRIDSLMSLLKTLPSSEVPKR